MHARLKKLEREEGNMGREPLRGRAEAPAPICGLPSHEQGFCDANFALAANGTNGHPEHPFQHEVCTPTTLP